MAAGEETAVLTHTYTYETPQATPITVGFRKPAEWANVYLYSWNDGGATLYTGKWPGSKMTESTKDNGMYYHQFDASVKEVNFIFNNGAATAIQTSDLWTDEDVCYEWESGKEKLIDCPGVSTDVEEVQPSQPALVLALPMYNFLGQ